MSDVAIQTVNTSTPNSGTGDTIYNAFTKVNNNTSNLAIAVNVIQNNYANTTLGKFEQIQLTNGTRSVLGSIYFTGSDTIYVNGSPVATSASTFSGGNVALQANFLAATNSTSSGTGAVTIPNGGLGVGGNVNFANNLVVSKNISTTTGTISVGSSTDSSDTSSGALVVAGGLGVGLNTHLAQGLYVGGLATIGSTLAVTGITSLTSSTTSVGTGSGALVVTGGVGIGGNLNVGGNGAYAGDVAVTGNLTVAGRASYGTETLTVTDNIIDVHTFANLAPLTYDDGKDIGIKFHYYKAGGIGDAFAFLGWANDTMACEYYVIGSEGGGGTFTGTYGTFKGGEYLSVNTTPSISSTTGAIRTSGGVGVEGNINVGGSNGNALVTTANIYAGNIIVNGISVNGGGINNVAIGAVTPSTGKFTTVTVTTSVVPSANLGANIGSTTAWFNNVYGTAIHAQYADLAENYLADADYAPGTVVVFGGEQEITVTQEFADATVAGVISTNPAYLMNGACGGVPLALRGRVPTNVIGPVRKGDSLVTSTTTGFAVSVGTDKTHGQAVFAKALETNLSEGEKTIEAVIL